MHEHKTCLHKNLKHCSKCDVVYCEDCKREWGREGWTYLDNSCDGTTIPDGTGNFPFGV